MRFNCRFFDYQPDTSIWLLFFYCSSYLMSVVLYCELVLYKTILENNDLYNYQYYWSKVHTRWLQTGCTMSLPIDRFHMTSLFSKIQTWRATKVFILIRHKNRLLHRKCDVRIFIHELQDFGKRTSERSERVSFPKSCNEWIKIRTKHFLCCNLFIVYITRIKQTH